MNKIGWRTWSVVLCCVCGAAVASEIPAPGQPAEGGAVGVQGVVVVPRQPRTTSIGGGPSEQSAVEGVKGVSVGSPAGREAAPSGAAELAAPRAGAAAATGETLRQGATGHAVRAEVTPARLRNETASSDVAKNVAAAPSGRTAGAERAAEGAVIAAPGKAVVVKSAGETRVANRANVSRGVHGVRVESASGQALSETSNVRVREQVAHMSPDRAWNVNQADAIAVRKRAEELRASSSVASKAVRSSADAIRARREVLAMSTPLGVAESTARGEVGTEIAPVAVAEEISTGTTRVEVVSGTTLVHVSARNVSDVVVERPVVEIVLPKGMRYEAVASAPPNTAVRVLRSEKGEIVEMVLPFALFEREAAQIAVQTSPVQEVGVSGVRARVRPLEEGLRTTPQGATTDVAPQGAGSATVREHLHPRE